MAFLRGKWVMLIAAALAAAVVCVPVFAQQEGGRPKSGLIEMSEAERDWIAGHARLRLGQWLESPPIIFRGDDGAMQGLVPAYVNLISEKLGLEPTRVRASSLAAMMELARAHEVDVVSAMISDADTGGEIIPSEPYLFMPIVVVTRSDFRFISGLADLEGLTVAMERAHVPHQRIPEDYPGIHPLVVDGPARGLRAVVSGEAAAYVGAQPTIAYLSQHLGLNDLRISAITEYSYSLSVGVRRDWPVLLGLVNRALASVSEEERKSISDYWTVLRAGQWMERPKAWRLIGAVSGAAGVLVLLFLFWNRRLAREVGQRKLVEQELRKAHEATRQVIESADVIIIGLDYTGHVRLLNAAGEAATGYSRQELLGKDWFDTVVPRERFPFVWDEFSRLARQGKRPSSESFENPIITKSGGVRHIQWRNSCLGPEHGVEDVFLISFGTDITNRVQAEEELRLTQFAMDNAAMGVLRVRPSGRIVYANRTAATMLGLTRSGVRRMTLPDVTTAIDDKEWPLFWARLKEQHVTTFESSISTEDGKDVPVEIRAYYLLFKGAELAICFFVDISERKRVERLHEDVERMVRHDLRSPTLAVQTLLVFLDRADNLTAQQRELLETAKASSQRMLGIIDLSRTLFTMEEGTYKAAFEPVDLVPLVSAVASELAPLMRARKVRMAVNVEGEPASSHSAFMVLSDELPCYALLANLLKNAVEASPEGGAVTLDLRTSDVHVISVHNAGVIPETIRDVFFEKYVTMGKMQGTGLGTYTARLIATALGGDIAFTTSAGTGTTLTVTLPLRSESDS
jgi:PAS domain S-box-containing protein